jgi:hypothetical protein
MTDYQSGEIDGRLVEIIVSAGEGLTIRIDGEIADRDRMEQVWGACGCVFPPRTYGTEVPGDHHQNDCLRYRPRGAYRHPARRV